MSGFAPGSTVAGKFRLLAPLGRGAMGEVWKAEHLLLRTAIALKFIHPDHLSETGPNEHPMLDRFFQEARATAALRSPHVVQILDFGLDGNVPFIAMELLEGETLEQRLARVGTLSPRQTADVITHVARAIGKAHEAGVIHRDLKPANVFLIRNDDEELAKVLDFGIAKVGPTHGAYRSTQTGTLIGTPSYMSPEQVQASRTMDHRTDLWSLAVIAFECLTGKLPFDGEVFGSLVLSICVNPVPVPSSLAPTPPGFDAWFAKGVRRNPDERFQSAKELADSLRSALCGEARPSQVSAQPSTSLLSGAPHLPMAPSAPAAAPPTFRPVPVSASTNNVLLPAPNPTQHAVVSQVAAPRRRRASTAVVGAASAGALLVAVAAFAGYRGLRGASGEDGIAQATAAPVAAEAPRATSSLEPAADAEGAPGVVPGRPAAEGSATGQAGPTSTAEAPEGHAAPSAPDPATGAPAPLAGPSRSVTAASGGSRPGDKAAATSASAPARRAPPKPSSGPAKVDPSASRRLGY